MERLKIDLHMHTDVSDGTDTPEQLLEKVRENGLDVFSVTDHDAVKACGILAPLIGPGDPRLLTGAEFSCRDEDGLYHILGYGFSPDAGPVRDLVAEGHAFRRQKTQARLDYLRRRYGIVFPEEETDRLLALDNPGKPHFGILLTRYGYAETKDGAIRKYLDGLSLPDLYVRPEEAIRGIIGGGGIAVLAHPSFGDGRQLIRGEDMDRRLKKLTGYGLQGVEAFYSGFDAGLRKEMLSFAEKYGLYATAGSDYHGNNKSVQLGRTGLERRRKYPEALLRFLRDSGAPDA